MTGTARNWTKRARIREHHKAGHKALSFPGLLRRRWQLFFSWQLVGQATNLLSWRCDPCNAYSRPMHTGKVANVSF